jgi:hypothetical protein
MGAAHSKHRSRSQDGGRTRQTDPKPAWSFHFNDSAVAALHSQVLQLRSGKLVCIFEVNTLVATESGFTGGGSFLLCDSPRPAGEMFSLTSRDGGQSWASPANLDGPPYIRTPPTGVDVPPVLWIAEARGDYGSEIYCNNHLSLRHLSEHSDRYGDVSSEDGAKIGPTHHKCCSSRSLTGRCHLCPSI